MINISVKQNKVTFYLCLFFIKTLSFLDRITFRIIENVLINICAVVAVIYSKSLKIKNDE